jgi:glycosyltransferase involved in cell wall biosynthesis
MKVLYCTPGLAINSDAPWATRQRAGGMLAAGLEVVLMVSRPEERRYFADMGCEIVVDEMASDSSESRRGLPNLWEFIVRPARIQWRAYTLARKLGADILYFSHPEPWTLLPIVWLRNCRHQRPAVSMFSTTVYRHLGDTSIYSLKTRVRGWLNHAAVWFLCPLINVIFDNAHVPQFFRRRAGEKCTVLLDGYHDIAPPAEARAESRQRLAMPPSRRVLLSFGVASRLKGQDLLLEALHGLEPTFDVYMVGLVGGVYVDPQAGARDLLSGPWRDHLHFVSRHVSDAEMCDYFTATDAVILPYRWGFVSTSGNFRLAMQYRRAVIAADQYFIGEMVRNRELGLLFPPENVEAMREQLAEFGRKPPAWFDQVAENERQLTHEQSWDATGRQYRELFTRLLAEHDRAT